ncbi:MAG: alanyl-tRNA editing protein [Gallicola sp.]|nr:alanyl-tRNA editing protein [Gallicola sp.]
MKTEAVYNNNPYLKRVKGKIIDIRYRENMEVLFDKTIFYPEGGGQPSDRGYIERDQKRFLITNVQEEGEIWHTVEEGEKLEVGMEVEEVLDWDRRFRNMQAHSAEHIFSGLLAKYHNANNIGFYISEKYFTCDYDIPLGKEKIREIEILANKIIQKNIPIDSYYPPEEELDTLDYRSKKEIQGRIRITRIPEVDNCACCGTHVGYSGEIGYMKLITVEKYKKGIRCTIKAGMPAVEHSIEAFSIIEEIGRKHSCSMEDIIGRLEKAEKEQNKLVEEIKALKKEKIRSLIEKIDSQKEIFLEEDLGIEDGRDLANELLQKIETVFLRLEKDQFLIASKEKQAKEIFEEMKEFLRGGGSESMVQGKILSGKEELEERFYSILERASL